jgi:hypothetical protein
VTAADDEGILALGATGGRSAAGAKRRVENDADT